MSLGNIGKVANALKEAEGLSGKKLENFLKKTLAGLSDKEINSALKILGANADDVAGAFAKVGAEGVSAGTKLSNIFTGFGAVLTKLLPVIAAITAAFAAFAIADALIDTPQELADRMTEAFGEYENAQNEVNALNSELEQTKDKIAELQSKGHLSFVEQGELAKLKQTQKALENQIKIAEEKSHVESRKAASSVIHAYRGTFKDITQENIDYYDKLLDSSMQNAVTMGQFSDKNNIAAQIVALQHYQEAMAGISTSNELWDDYNNKVTQLTGSLWEQVDILTDYKSKLEAIPESDRTLPERETLGQIKEDLDYIYKELSPETWKQMKIDDVFSRYDTFGTKQELTDLAKQYNNLDDFIAAASKTQGAFAQSLYEATDGAVTLRDVAESIFAEAGIIDTNAVRKQLRDTFASTTGVGGWAEQAKGEFNAWANSLSDEDLKLVYKIMLDTDEANYDLATWKNILEEYREYQALDHGIDIATEQENLSKVTSAISESVSETGLLSESINSLKSRYKSLENFDADRLFENTANGVKLNTDYLGDLEDAYSSMNMEKLVDALDAATKKYAEANTLLDMNSNPEYADAYRIRAENALQEMKSIQQLIAQYEALNGLYAKAMNAASTPNAGIMRDNVKGLYDSAKELRKAGKIGTDDFQSFVELITGEDYFGEKGSGLQGLVNDFDNLNKKIKVEDTNGKLRTLSKSVSSFFADGYIGANNFISAIKEAGKVFGEDWISETDDGKLKLNVDSTSLANALGISEELVHILMENLKDYGFDFDTEKGTDSIDELRDKVNDLKSELESQNIELPKVEFNLDSEGVKNQIDEIKQWIDEVNNSEIGKNKNSNTYQAAMNYAKTALKATYAQEQEINNERFDLSKVQAGQKTIAARWNEAKDAITEYNAAIDTFGEKSTQAEEASKGVDTAISNLATTAKESGIGEIGDIELNTEGAEQQLRELMDSGNLSTEGIEINASINGTVTEELDQISAKLKSIQSQSITITVNSLQIDTAENRINALNDALTALSQIPEINFSLNTDISDGIDEVIDFSDAVSGLESERISLTIGSSIEGSSASDIQDFKSAISGLETKTIDVTISSSIEGSSAKDIDKLNDSIESLIVSKTVSIKVDGVENAITQVKKLRQELEALQNTQVNVNAGSVSLPQQGGETDGGTATGTINYELGDVAIPEGMTAIGTINYELGTVAKPDGVTATGTINYTLGTVAKPAADGTAWASGSTHVNGTAFAKGDWGLKNDVNSALVGELGQEIVVRNGQFFTVGDKGAEIIGGLRKHDIIFNAEQTKQLLQQGRITRGRRRGRALADGTVGHAFSGGTKYQASINKDLWDLITGNSGNGSGNKNPNNNSGNGSGKSPYTDDTNGKEIKDWIEILLDRFDKVIDALDNIAGNIYKSFNIRNSALAAEISKLEEQIKNNEEAYKIYMDEADRVGLDAGVDEKLPEDWKKKVRDGELKIDVLQDETLIEYIGYYEEWYNKAEDCKYAIEELKETLADCYQAAFDNIVTQYDQLVAVVEHSKNILDESISQSEARGYIVSKKFYEAQADAEIERIKLFYEERTKLEESLNKAVNEGTIIEGSEAYMDMMEEINGITLAIEESNTELLNLNKSIREVDWEIFDLLQDRIHNISEESKFLIDLLSNKKLHDENGKLTDEGLTTIGLHGQNYNTYSAQAKIYADEIAELNKQIEADPYNQDLISRRDTLLNAQQDNIIAAEKEKQAIVDLVEEGYNVELDALQESIDAYNDRLDSAKDLYEYQKKIKDQVKEISSIEKQMAAYEGDESQEAKAKVQKLKVSLEEAKSSLEETQYDKYISDQKELLDELYIEYEDLLNERLDNVDALFEEMIAKSNNNALMINDTLLNTAESVGYKLSNELQNIWSANNGLNNILKSNNLEVMSTNNKIKDTVIVISNNIQTMMEHLGGVSGVSLIQMSTNVTSKPDSYSAGIGHISQNDIARTYEEKKMEFIIRPSDGAILTPVAQDDSILSSYDSGNIWKMTNSPTEIIRDKLDLDSTTIPSNRCVQQIYTQNLEKVVFNLPNVKNYDEMLSAMQKDKNFERLILSMSIDRLAGRSYLAKNKSIR